MSDLYLKVKNRFRSKSPSIATGSGQGAQSASSNTGQSSQVASAIKQSDQQTSVPATNVVTQPSHTPLSQPLAPQPDLWREANQRLPAQKQEIVQKLLPASTSSTKSGLDICVQLKSLAEARRVECEKQQWKFKFRDKEIILRDVAEKTVVWLTKFKEIGDVVVNYDPVHLALPWAGVRFLLQCAIQDSQQMGTILVGLETITRLMNFCEVYEELYVRPSKPNKALKNLEESLIDFPEKLEKLLQKLAELEKSVRYAANACESVRSQDRHTESNEKAEKLSKILRDLEEPIRRIDTRVAALLQKVEDSERSEVLCWLSQVPYEDNHKNAKSGRAASTGQWLLKHDTYHAWRNSSASTILWLHGIPGAGKTKLVTHVVDDLIGSLNRQQNDEGLAYFYCDRNDRDRQNPLRVMQSFIKQLATPRTNDVLQSSIVKIYTDKKRAGFASNELDMKECQGLFNQYIDLYPQTTIVLDALDECDPRTRFSLIKVLCESVSRALRPTKIFISSRDDHDIKCGFAGAPNVMISARDNVHDISTFVAQTLQEANESRDMKISPLFQEEIVSTLTKKSQGMCQWAALQLNQLLEIDLEDDMKDRLGQLPKDLKQAYDEIYAQISKPGGRTATLAKRALLWVMRAETPLSPSQLVPAICQDPGSDTVNAVNVDMGFVLKICRNLLVVDQELQVCRFSHLSIQEYLEEYQLKPIEADCLISQVCLQLLVSGPGFAEVTKMANNSYEDSNSQSEHSPERPQEQGRHIMHQEPNRCEHSDTADLMWYVVYYWPEHVRRCEVSEERKRLTGPLMEFLGSPSNASHAYTRWREAITDVRFYGKMAVRLSWFRELGFASLPISAMCCLGLFDTLEQWWTPDVINPSIMDPGDTAPLTLAATWGHLNICEWLICHEFHLNPMGKYDDRAVIRASRNGHFDVVRLLLDHGVDVNLVAKGETHSTALIAASDEGHYNVVQLLLDHGSDANLVAKGEIYSTALVAASSQGHYNVVQLLLDHGADVNLVAKGEIYSTALIAASWEGHCDIVQLLLDHGADVNLVAKGETYSTALIAASTKGYYNVVQLLLDHGADDSLESGSVFSTALVAALWKGYYDVVQLLLDYGADVNLVAKGGVYSTALITASWEGHCDVVQLLLNHGADVNLVAKGETYSTALIAASTKGYFNVVQLLLGHGADVNLKNWDYPHTALIAALSVHRHDIVQLLRSHGAIEKHQ